MHLFCVLAYPERATDSAHPEEGCIRLKDRRARCGSNSFLINRVYSAIFFAIIPFLVLALTGCGGAIINGAASASGSLQISPGSVSFGTVSVGSTATANISVVNSGSGPATISSLNVSGNSFALNSAVSLPVTVAAGSTYALSVKFNPSATGSATGQLSVASDSASSGTAVAGLSGTGAASNSTTLTLTSLTCTYAAANSGTDPCTVTLNSAAPSGGTVVSLASNNSAVSVPASVTVAAGATTASFNASVTAASGNQAVVLSASAGGITEDFSLEVEEATPGLNVSTTSLAFGSVAVGTSVTQTLTLSSTGAAAVTLSSAALTGTGYSISGASFPLTLNPGQSTSLTVQFDPSLAGAVGGQLTLTDNANGGTSTIILLNGSGVPTLTAFTCTSASITGAATDACTVTLNAAAASGGYTVGLSSNNSAVSVPTSVTVTAGSSTGGFSANVSAVSTAQNVTLSASTGTVSITFALLLNVPVPTLTVNATSIAFGDDNLNTSATQTVTLTSSGTGSVTVSSVTASGTGFSVSAPTLPLTLGPTQTATVSVVFDPTTAGAATGQLTIVSTSSTNPTDVIGLTGTGESGSLYQVNLTWDAPTSSSDPVAGYNIYRAPNGSSTYVLLGSVSNTVLAYTDNSSLTDGQIYDYMVESVDGSGNTSAPSNVAPVSIP